MAEPFAKGGAVSTWSRRHIAPPNRAPEDSRGFEKLRWTDSNTRLSSIANALRFGELLGLAFGGAETLAILTIDDVSVCLTDDNGLVTFKSRSALASTLCDRFSTSNKVVVFAIVFTDGWLPGWGCRRCKLELFITVMEAAVPLIPFALPFSGVPPVSIASHRCNNSVARRSKSSSSSSTSVFRPAPGGESCCLLRRADTASKPLPLAGDISAVADRAGEDDDEEDDNEEEEDDDEEREAASSGLSGAAKAAAVEPCTVDAAGTAAGMAPRDPAERDVDPNGKDALNCSLRSPQPPPPGLAGPPGPRFHHTWLALPSMFPPLSLLLLLLLLPPPPPQLLPPPLPLPPMPNCGSLLLRSSGDVGPPCRKRCMNPAIVPAVVDGPGEASLFFPDVTSACMLRPSELGALLFFSFWSIDADADAGRCVFFCEALPPRLLPRPLPPRSL